MDFHERIAQQLVAGNGAGAGSFPTFNGNVTYDPNGLGARRGMFEVRQKQQLKQTPYSVLLRTPSQAWHKPVP